MTLIITITWILMLSPVHSDVTTFTAPSWGDQTKNCSENAPASTIICQVALSSSTDYTVKIQTQNPIYPPFQLVPNNLLQWTLHSPASAEIDRESTPNFTFVFNATNGVNTAYSVMLTVIVTDQNDNFPQFANDSYKRTIYDTEPSDRELLAIQADDADLSPNITYSISGGNVGNTFSIDPKTGQLKLTTSSYLNASSTPTYNLTVQASDGTNANYTTVIIHVVDDLCVPSPCYNNGTCSRNNTSYNCTCSPGWLGDQCQKADPCSSFPCMNGGSCAVNGMAFTCSCTSGFHGSNCNETGDPCVSKPCTNGGTCTSAGITFRCLCVSGTTGNTCSQIVATTVSHNETQGQESKTDSLLAVYIVVPILALSGIVLAAIAIYKHKKDNKVDDDNVQHGQATNVLTVDK